MLGRGQGAAQPIVRLSAQQREALNILGEVYLRRKRITPQYGVDLTRPQTLAGAGRRGDEDVARGIAVDVGKGEGRGQEVRRAGAVDGDIRRVAGQVADAGRGPEQRVSLACGRPLAGGAVSAAGAGDDVVGPVPVDVGAGQGEAEGGARFGAGESGVLLPVQDEAAAAEVALDRKSVV